MSIALLSDSPLQENEALFENTAISGQTDGFILWGTPFQDGEVWKVTFEGQDVTGQEITETTIEIPESETLNPTKIFWWIAEAAKSTLCPQCL